jgi:hypothetical protein
MKGNATDASVYGSSVVVLVATMIDASVSDISLASKVALQRFVHFSFFGWRQHRRQRRLHRH